MCLMTDKKQWKPVPISTEIGSVNYVEGDAMVSADKIKFYEVPKLAAFQIPMSHPDIKSAKLKTPVTCLKTGYSSGLVLFDGDGNTSKRGKKVMFTETDMVTPLGMNLFVYELKRVVAALSQVGTDGKTDQG